MFYISYNIFFIISKMNTNTTEPRLILGIGNPIIDISAETDADTLNK